jgi:hypothetical protein
MSAVAIIDAAIVDGKLLRVMTRAKIDIFYLLNSVLIPMSISLDVMCLPKQTGHIQNPTLQLQCFLMCLLHFNVWQSCCWYHVFDHFHSAQVQYPPSNFGVNSS